MPPEPAVKRCIAFFDGQNLFHNAKQAFGYTYPNYDPLVLASNVCVAQGWTLAQARFYTGIPDAADNVFWHAFWVAKLAKLGHQGVHVFSRRLRYRLKQFTAPDGTPFTVRVGEEKGIDVRIAIDVISLARRNANDVALIFSQDQDLSEAADEIRVIAHEQGRWIKIASAFPEGAGTRNRRGINGADWMRIDKPTYDAAIDPFDHRPQP